MPDYRFEPATHSEEEIVRTSALLKVVFPQASHLTPDYLRWMYAQNPDGLAIACNAFSGNELVGHMAGIPVRARVSGAELAGMIVQNGAVHPAHRGRRLQSHISVAMFEQGVERGHDFSLAIGNKYSTGPLLTRFAMIGPLEARIGVGTLRRREGKAPSFERLWSPERLNWRLRNPQRLYSVRAGRVYAPVGRPGIAALIHENASLADQGPEPPGPLRLFLGSDPGASFAGSGYLQIPRLLRPSPLNLVWRDLAGGAPMPDPARFMVRGFDLDYY